MGKVNCGEIFDAINKCKEIAEDLGLASCGYSIGTFECFTKVDTLEEFESRYGEATRIVDSVDGESSIISRHEDGIRFVGVIDNVGYQIGEI